VMASPSNYIDILRDYQQSTTMLTLF
jgi:hypothetical protein